MSEMINLKLLSFHTLIFLFLIFNLNIQKINTQYDLQDYGVIIDNAQKAKYHWGTYKPNLYFALKNRRNTSQVFGLMWYGSDEKNFEETPEFENRIRHDCKMEDDLNYHWNKHNGFDFADQLIEDKKLNLKLSTKFIKNSYNFTSQSWDAVIEGDLLNNEKDSFNGEVSLLLYNHLENNAISDKAYYTFLPDGTIEAQEKGRKEFYMKYIIDQGEVIDSSHQKYRKVYNETWRIKQFVSEDLKNSEIKINEIKPKVRNIDGEQVKSFTKNPEWIRGKFVTKNIKSPNIIVQQYVFKKPFRIFVKYSLTPFSEEVTNLSVDDLKNIRNNIENNLKNKEENFEKKFDEVFPIRKEDENLRNFVEKFSQEKNLDKNLIEKDLRIMGQQALSNILGGIGHFWGAIKINFEEKLQPGQYHKGFRYAVEEKELLTGTPSRPFFPRGFLWDEGFHNILISKWDVNLSIDIINTWLSTMSATGWMAREQIRGN